MKTKKILVNFAIFLLIIPLVIAYKIEPGKSAVHQKITKEAIKVWSLIPDEIKNHSGNSIDGPLDQIFTADYDPGDDLITASGEEDTDFGVNVHINTNHFWDPDDPDTLSLGIDDYDNGLGPSGSSYRRALLLWRTEVIPSYLRGNVDRSYYYLGRVAHLLEDAAQPSHVLLDPHPIFSILEDYTGNISVYQKYNGSIYQSQQYNYDNLVDNFNWKTVEPFSRPSDRQNIELFRLFWYTAQKTQYWASDDVNGNQIYVNLSGSTLNWQCGTSSSLNLWKNESYSCSYIINASANLNSNTVDKEANATIPHAMKAVAGLYKLFWDAVHTDWSGFQNNLRRTGFSVGKGDITSSDKVILWNKSESISGFFVKYPVIGEVDEGLDEGMEVLVATGAGSTVKALDGKTNTQLWSYANIGPTRNIAIDDLNGDGKKEVVASDINGKVVVLNAQDGTLKWSYHVDTGAEAVSIAVADIDNLNQKEVVIGEFDGATYVVNGSYVPALVNLYALDKNGNLIWTSDPIENGPQFDPAIADIDNDGNLEIVVTTFYSVYALNAENGSLLWNRSINQLIAPPTIADVDGDNQYEVIVSSLKPLFGSGSCALNQECYNAVYVLDGASGNIEWNRSVDYPIVAASAVANLDNDNNPEIVVATNDGPNFRNYPNKSIGKGTLYVFDGKTGNQQWNYSVGGKVETAPAIADIDSDGKLEIVFGAYDGKVYAVDESGNLEWTHNFGSIIVYSSAIGDIDGDGVIEIMIQHADGIGENASDVRGPSNPDILNASNLTNPPSQGGGGEALTLRIEIISGRNRPPVLNNLTNITANVTQLIDLNATGQIRATDPDNDTLTFFYSSPFNSSGQWQTTKNDSGVYPVVVEVSDGNLSDSQTIYVTVISFTPTTPSSLLCNEEFCSLNKTFYGSIEINCSGSTDIENDSITYGIDAYYNHTGYTYTGPLTNSTNKFSNGLSVQNLTFDQDNLDIIRYLDIPRFAKVTSAFMNLSGYNVSLPNVTEQNAEDAARVSQGVCDDENNNPCSNGYDEDWDTFASPGLDADFHAQVTIEENFTIPLTAVGATTYFKIGGGQFGRFFVGCRNATGAIINNDYLFAPTIPTVYNKSIPIGCLQAGTLTTTMNFSGTYPVEQGSIYYETKIIWYHSNFSYPTNVSLEVGTNDSSPEWSYAGTFNKKNNRTGDLASAINRALNNESCDCKGCVINGDNCLIPFFFHSSKPGKLEYSAINVTYNLIPTRYAWRNIGNHLDSDILNWGLSGIQNQDKIGLRCRAIDEDGSRNYSAYYTPAMNLSITNVTPRIGITLVTPNSISSTVNVSKGDFFNVTVNVSCTSQSGADCWKINVSFDPEPEKATYTESSDKICNGNICTLTLYSGIRNVYEDGAWKRVDDAKSLKDKGFSIKYLEVDEKYPIEILDFNYTSVTFDLTLDEQEIRKSIPIRVWEINETKLFSKRITKNSYKDYSELKKSKKVRQLRSEETYTFEIGLDKIVEIGGNSTTITLQEPNSENLKDAYVVSDQPNNNYGSASYLKVQGNWSNYGFGRERTYLSWNISKIFNNASILNITYANLSLNTFDTSSSISYYMNLSLFYLYNDWVNSTGFNVLNESQLTWNNQPCGVNFGNNTNCNLTSIDKALNLYYTDDGIWVNFNVTAPLQAFFSTNKTNISFSLKPERSDESENVEAVFYSKEYATASLRPKLTIIYLQTTEKTGLISTIIGETPFYTNESNPRTIKIRTNESKTVTAFINATGNLGSNHTFFVYANLSSNLAVSNITNKWNVTIVKKPTIIKLSSGNITQDGHIRKDPFGSYSRDVTSTVINIGYDGTNTYRGYIDFNTSSISSNATIDDVKLNLTFTGLGTYNCDVNPLEKKPISVSDQNLYNDVGNGTAYVNNNAFCKTGSSYYPELDLGGNADADLQNLLSEKWFGVGIKWDNDGYPNSGTIAYSYSSESNFDPILVVTYTV